jgi:hypothetical protein
VVVAVKSRQNELTITITTPSIRSSDHRTCVNASRRWTTLDYSSLRTLAATLGNVFWKDLERHHPGIDSLHLPREVAQGWKQSLRTTQKTVTTDAGAKAVVTAERVGYGQCLTRSGRSTSYLDLAHWAVGDPARWGRWVAPCPAGEEEINQREAARRRKSRMDARTRERLPVLPVLVRPIDGAPGEHDGVVVVERGEQMPARGVTVPRAAQGLPVDRDPPPPFGRRCHGDGPDAEAASSASPSGRAKTRRNIDSSGTRTIPGAVDAVSPASAAHSPTAANDRAPAGTAQVAGVGDTGSRCRLPRRFRGSVTCPNTAGGPDGDADGERPPTTAEAS